MFSTLRLLKAALLLAVCSASVLKAADLSTYREFRFGTKMETIISEAGLNKGAIRVVQQQPSMIQEADWQPRTTRESVSGSDSVRDAVLSFYNGELYRIVIVYDRYKIEGMTLDDMVEQVSRAYGVATKPGGEIPYHSNYAESAELLARWEDASYAGDLVRTGDRASFSLVLYSKRVNALAQAAMVEAARLEAMDAPRRELEKQQKRDDEARALLEKARTANKLAFRP